MANMIIMPTFAKFSAQFAELCPNGFYTFNDIDGTSTHHDCEDMYGQIANAVEQGNCGDNEKAEWADIMLARFDF